MKKCNWKEWITISDFMAVWLKVEETEKNPWLFYTQAKPFKKYVIGINAYRNYMCIFKQESYRNKLNSKTNISVHFKWR